MTSGAFLSLASQLPQDVLLGAALQRLEQLARQAQAAPGPDLQSAARARQEEERRSTLRGQVQAAAARRQLTPEVVAAYAELHLVDDVGQPIRPARLHRLWLQLLSDERIRQLLIIAPPETAKTTWTIAAWAGCYIGIWPQRNVIIGSVSETVAEQRSLSLRSMVETQEWQRTFPGVKRAVGLEWLSARWSLAPDGVPTPGRLHPTVSAYGTGGSITGSRADLVIADDLLNFENSRTQHQRWLVNQWLHNSLLTRLKSGTGRIVVIGTAWDSDDIYAKARKGGGWVVCHTPLLSASAAVYAFLTYPDDWPYERLGEPLAQAALID